MAQNKYIELIQKFNERNSELVGFQNGSGVRINVVDINSDTNVKIINNTKIYWICANDKCRKEQFTALKSIINKEQFLCRGCSRYPNRDVNELCKLFEAHNSKLTGMEMCDSDGNKSRYDINDSTPRIISTTKVYWLCKEGNHEVLSTLNSIISRKRNVYICQDCAKSPSKDINKIKLQFISKNSELLGVVVDDQFIEIDDVNLPKITNASMVKWICSNEICKQEQITTLEYITNRQTTKYLCQQCVRSAGKNIDHYQGIFEKHKSKITGVAITDDAGVFTKIDINDNNIPPLFQHTRVYYICADCKCEINHPVTLSSIINRNSDSFVCRSCAKHRVTAKEQDTTINGYIKLFEANGSELIGYIHDQTQMKIEITKDTDLSKRLLVRTKVIWRCKMCKHTINTSQIQTATKTFSCRGCGISASKGEYTYHTFKKSLEDIGWQLIDGPDKYINTKSVLACKCSNSHEITMSYNRFTSGGRCKHCDITSKKLNTMEISEKYKKHGFELLDDKYVNNKTKMKVKCISCEKICEISISNLKHIGCTDCNKKWILNEVKKLLYDNDCELIEDDKTPKCFINETSINFKCHISRDNNVIHTTTLKQFKSGARCPMCTNIKRQNTNMEKYGVGCVFQSDHFREKQLDYYQTNYGVAHNMQVSAIKDKARETNIINNGQHNLNRERERQLSKDAMVKKYGVPYPLQSIEVRHKCLETMVAKYGVKYPVQNPETMRKIQSMSYRSKEYKFPSGKIVKVQGYEHYAIDDLLKSGFNEYDIQIEYLAIPYKMGDKQHKYYPDIFIKSQNLVIEVKSAYTLEKEIKQNIEKFDATIDKGYKLEIWIYERNRSRNIIEYGCATDVETSFGGGLTQPTVESETDASEVCD